jgi:hypothetical protein
MPGQHHHRRPRHPHAPNIFKFGDTFWKQKTGTVMGTPPGTNYSELYYSTREIEFTISLNSTTAPGKLSSPNITLRT